MSDRSPEGKVFAPVARNAADDGIDAAIAATARAVSFGGKLAARGVTTVALDAAGQLTRYAPDRTATPVR